MEQPTGQHNLPSMIKSSVNGTILEDDFSYLPSMHSPTPDINIFDFFIDNNEESMACNNAALPNYCNKDIVPAPINGCSSRPTFVETMFSSTYREAGSNLGDLGPLARDVNDNHQHNEAASMTFIPVSEKADENPLANGIVVPYIFQPLPPVQATTRHPHGRNPRVVPEASTGYIFKQPAPMEASRSRFQNNRNSFAVPQSTEGLRSDRLAPNPGDPYIVQQSALTQESTSYLRDENPPVASQPTLETSRGGAVSNLSVRVARKRARNNYGLECHHCGNVNTPQWRSGPLGRKTLCNACGVRYKSGKLFPEYRPAASPTSNPQFNSNSHRMVMAIRRRNGLRD